MIVLHEVVENKSPTNAQNTVSDEVLRFLMGILLRQHNRLKLAALGDIL